MTDVTLNAFLRSLDAADPEAGVVFATEQGPVGAGYHITELKHSTVKSIDCGGRQMDWHEAAVQVLDVYGDAPMPVSKLRTILTRSVSAIPGLGSAPVHIEFGHKNQHLSRYEIAGLEVDQHLVKISMVGARATCKPATDPGVEIAKPKTRVGCCA